MHQRPNILFLMADQMQGRVLDPQHPCHTPHLDRLMQRGVRISNAYTPNPICSPARASLMTGLLPHRHGVFSVTHTCHDYHCDIDPAAPHWAQQLVHAGYRTGYFGKWHIERREDLVRFGWQEHVTTHSPRWRQRQAEARAGVAASPAPGAGPSLYLGPADGYRRSRFYEVIDEPLELRACAITASLAADFLRDAGDGEPWCCFVSTEEPHDPFVCGRDAYSLYDVEAIQLPATAHDDLHGRPNLYRKAGRAFSRMTDRQRREAAACYWGSITEIDQQFGRLLQQLDDSGQADNTIVVMTSDHGELLGAHGLYMKNVGAFEEAYNIPMVLAGPGIAHGHTTPARVGLHDLCPTLCELAGAPSIVAHESRSLTPLLRDPQNAAANFTRGYAEYSGGRYWLTQRVIWDGDWKLVWNGFDFDELYNLREDADEWHNRIDDPACQSIIERLMKQAWRMVRDTDDHPLLHSQYPALQLAPLGPEIINDDKDNPCPCARTPMGVSRRPVAG